MKHTAFLERPRPVSFDRREESLSPALISEVEIGRPLPALSATHPYTGQPYQRAQCLVRLHTQPLGLLELSLDAPEISASTYAERIWRALGKEINAHLRADGLADVPMLSPAGLPTADLPVCQQERARFLHAAPFASVVLCTRDRPDRLARCLPALLAQQYPDYEVVLVDNAPSSEATAAFIERHYGRERRLRYVREQRAGLSAARNRGVREARGEIVAFTDDDVIADAHWLSELAHGFAVADQVACVTSLILPLELDTPAQFWFEEFGGFNKGFQQRIFDQQSGKKAVPLYPFAAGGFGTGAGMAFTAAFLRKEKGFDRALGAGTRTGGGEDLAAFFRVIARGYRLVYAPGSLLYHQHRREYTSLRKQIFYYGAGLTAYLTKIVADNPLLLLKIAARVPEGLVFLLSSRSKKNQKKTSTFPGELAGFERKGMLQGPFLYLQGRLQPQ